MFKKDLGDLLPKDIKKGSFNVLSIYTGLIIEIVRKLKSDEEYNKFLKKDFFQKASEDDLFNFSFNKYYLALNSINQNLSEFVYKINFILFQIDENINLHDSHKNLLIKYIAKEVLCDYFLMVLNKTHFDYYMIPSKITGQDLNYKTAFESHEIEIVYDYYKKSFPKIMDEVLYLNR